MYSTSSCAFPDGQLSVLQVTSFVPWMFQPMLLRVWKLTVQAFVAAAESATVQKIVDVFIFKFRLRIQYDRSCCRPERSAESRAKRAT
jgi:hypothetical protein